MQIRRLLGMVAATALSAVCLGADRDLEISYAPLFLSTTQPANFAPFKIRCENKGKSTKGVFTIDSGQSRTNYPVDLPTGSKKEFIAYLPPQSYEPLYGTLITDIGRARIRFPEMGYAGNCLVSISNSEGVLNFSKSMETMQGRVGYSFSPMSAKPSDLPDRATAYLSAAAVFLGDGAETIKDEAFSALERYVLVGGTLVISGGASTPLFNDPKWRPLLPVVNPKPETMSPDPGDQVAGLQLRGEFTMSVGAVAPGAIVKGSYRNRPFIVSKPYGLGRVVFLAVNAFENPVSQWPGKVDLIAGLNLAETTTKMSSLQAMAMGNDHDPYGGSYYGSGVSTYSSGGSPYGSTPSDPFSASVPPTSTVVWILIAYFVLVVPINLLVLKKLGRGELAWITSPILSLGFAAIFFRFAADLYSAELSTATKGVIVAEQNSRQSYFMGGSQMFFPRGGKYDLKLEDVEGIRPRNADPYSMYGGREAGLNDFEPTDTGQIHVRDLPVANLSFKEFAYFEARDDEWLSVVPAGKNAVRLTNRSGKEIKSGSLYFDGGIADVGDLKAGESREVKLVNSGNPRRDTEYMYGMSLMSMLMNQAKLNRIAVTADVEGRFGPQVGKLVPGLSRIQLVWFGTKGGA